MDLADHSIPHIEPPEYSGKSSLNSDEKFEYESLLQEAGNFKLSQRSKSRWFPLTKHWIVFNVFLTALNLVTLVTIVIVFGVRHAPTDSSACLLPPSPASVVVEKELRSFSLVSPYSEPPNPVTDQLWHDLVDTGALFPITPEELAKVNDEPETAVKYAHDPQGRYVATLASTHQIHCVDSLRKGLWFHWEYYRDKGDELFIVNDPPEEHLMHCVEMLRNAIMCAGDVSLLTFNWHKGHAIPKSNFRGMHSCQKWDKIQDWRVANNITEHVKTLERPAGWLDEEPDESEGFSPGGYEGGSKKLPDGTTEFHLGPNGEYGHYPK